MRYYIVLMCPINIIWYIQLQLGSQPVAVVQYTYTHKQYRERQKINNTYNNTKIKKSAGRAPSLRVLPLQLRKKHGKPFAVNP